MNFSWALVLLLECYYFNPGMIQREKASIGVILHKLDKETHMLESKNYIQHGNISVYTHSLSVAITSARFAYKHNISCDFDSLIRGALLHDYFLYDWHSKTHPKLHGFKHPLTAFRNASKELSLTVIEKDIIIHHMFPLTIVPPVSREAWIVCLCDKKCALSETFSKRRRKTKSTNGTAN